MRKTATKISEQLRNKPQTTSDKYIRTSSNKHTSADNYNSNNKGNQHTTPHIDFQTVQSAQHTKHTSYHTSISTNTNSKPLTCFEHTIHSTQQRLESKSRSNNYGANDENSNDSKNKNVQSVSNIYTWAGQQHNRQKQHQQCPINQDNNCKRLID